VIQFAFLSIWPIAVNTEISCYPPYRPAQTASVSKGVNAFDFSATANVIATGGTDKIVRVWHRGILSEPAARLVGHTFTIVDIVINDADRHIISLSTERVIRVWDIRTLTLLQVHQLVAYGRRYIDRSIDRSINQSINHTFAWRAALRVSKALEHRQSVMSKQE